MPMICLVYCVTFVIVAGYANDKLIHPSVFVPLSLAASLVASLIAFYLGVR